MLLLALFMKHNFVKFAYFYILLSVSKYVDIVVQYMINKNINSYSYKDYIVHSPATLYDQYRLYRLFYTF